MKHLVVGHLGQVGSAVFTVLGERWITVDGYDTASSSLDLEAIHWRWYNVLHVCIPGDSPYFITQVREYQKRVQPEITIVYSSTPVGTCAELGAVHSPIEGRHEGHFEETIEGALRRTARPFGTDDEELAELMEVIWRGSITIRFPDSRVTEFLKLRSTTLYGLEIAFTQYTKDVLEGLGYLGSPWRAYDYWYNEVYSTSVHLRRPVLKAPDGPIGGHCVVPNAKSLMKQFPSRPVRIVAEFNDKLEDDDAPDVG